MNTQTIEKVTLINGNGQANEKELPLLILFGKPYNDVALAHIEENTGLKFEAHYSGMAAQPTHSWQIAALLMTYNFKTRYFNNWQYTNTILLKSDHHTGWQVDSICYNCCKENHIATNGLQPHERLMC
jgi:hypothetical protein